MYMKKIALLPILFVAGALHAQTASTHYYIDVHDLGPGKVTAAAVAEAHAKDLAVEKKYGVHFINYWVDTAQGKVYCLSSAPDTNAIRKTHAEAHGLLPVYVSEVESGNKH